MSHGCLLGLILIHVEIEKSKTCNSTNSSAYDWQLITKLRSGYQRQLRLEYSIGVDIHLNIIPRNF